MRTVQYNLDTFTRTGIVVENVSTRNKVRLYGDCNMLNNILAKKAIFPTKRHTRLLKMNEKCKEDIFTEQHVNRSRYLAI